MATKQSPTPSEPRPPAEIVSVPTLRGEERIGEVVDIEMRARLGEIQRWYVVNIDGTTLRAPAAETNIIHEKRP